MQADSALSPHPRYRLLDRIGKGGMGEVFRTYDRLTGQMVALKRVRLPLPTALPAFPLHEQRQTSLGQAATFALEASPLPEALEQERSPTALATAAGSALQALGRRLTHFPCPPELAATMAASTSDRDGAQARSATPGGLASSPSPELQALRVHLTQEFRTLAGLRHPHIVSVLDYGFDRDQKPYFTMEFLDGGVPLDKAARGQPFSVQVNLLLQILQALTYLHRRGVLHRDLKPGNILVIPGPSGPQVKLLDFGLALLARDLRAPLADIAGTLGYIAPEVLVGVPPSESSDLFAVGVMAHEVFLGAHPLGKQPTAALIREFLGPSPIFSEDRRIPAALSAVLRRALCRMPTDRYVDAAAFGHELARAADLPLPPESEEIRESFLQAATFVAREEEIATLRRALDNATIGNGSLWLVGGESGVGKSRLLDELRTLALVRGTRVVRGQAVSAGGSAYEVWQGALRPLVLDAGLDDLDAGVLRAAVPDIALLLDRTIPEPPVVEPQNAQARFLYTVEMLLLSQREPLLLLLEDLHWAEPASLAVLQRLIRSMARHPLLVIGSYRHDERPTLLDELPGAQSLPLQRLSGHALALLSTSMLGEVGRRTEVVTLLERETAGNAFFVVEVLRTLAEEKGSLGQIGTGRLPEKVAAGGVQAVLARRLGRVPEEARPLLCASAVLGRELDLAVLRALPGDLGAKAEAQLAACSSAAVLEVSENRWRFTHDKLREVVLAEFVNHARPHWHRLIGEAMERAYSTNLGQHSAALGYHFDEAGEVARALPYRLQAGEIATRNGAVNEAIGQLERALELHKRVACTEAQRAHALGLLCRAYQGAGRPHECALVIEKMLAEAGFKTPRSSRQLFAEIARLAARHVHFRLSTWRQQSLPDKLKAPLQDTWLREVATAFVAAGEAVGMTRSPARMIHLTLANVAVAERLGDPVRMAPAYSILAYCLSPIPLRRISEGYIERARQLLLQVPDPPSSVSAYVAFLASILHVGRGEWAQAERCIGEALTDCRRAGDWRMEVSLGSQQPAIKTLRGDWAAAQDGYKELEQLVQRLGVAQHVGWARTSLGGIFRQTGDFSRAEALLGEAEVQAARANDRTLSIVLQAVKASHKLRQGEVKEARRLADAALELLLAAMPAAYALIEGPSVLAEVYLTLLSNAPDGAEQAELHQRIKQTLGLLRRLGVLFPIFRSRALLWHGRYAALRGHTRIAEWLLRQALQAAVRCQMPFDQARVHHALAEVAQARGDRVSVADERSKARLLFEQLGAHWHVAQLSKLDAERAS